MRFLFLISLLTCLIGCSDALPPRGDYSLTPKHTDVITLSKDFELSAIQWMEQARLYFDDPLIVTGHGLDSIGPWMQINEDNRIITVRTLALALHQIYPNRDIVLIICNPNHDDLDIDRVYYAKDIVYKVPDAYVTEIPFFGQRETERNFGNVGQIEEFYCKGKPMNVPRKPLR